MECNQLFLDFFQSPEDKNDVWKILIVDDDQEIHIVTKMVLEDIEFEGKPFSIISAFSAEEAASILHDDDSFALALIDVVMETEHAGLQLVRKIRDEIKNQFIRIILRTGQPGFAPEHRVILDYDINDYKEKTELTSKKLRTSIISALRSYRDLHIIDNTRYQMRKAGSYLESILQSLSSVVIVVDDNKRVMVWNRGAEKDFELHADTVLGKSIHKFSSIFGTVSDEVIESLGSDKPFGFREIHYPDGRIRNISGTHLRSREFHGTVLYIEDITELKKKEQQLQQSQKLEAVGSLAAGLAHDLNNILGGLVGAISLIEYELQNIDIPPDMHFPMYMATMKESTTRATGLVKQLLTLTRKQELRVYPLNLNKVVDHVISICENSFDKTVEIKTELVDDEPIVLGDYTQMEQSVLNLMINAAHAMTFMRSNGEEQGGILTVSVIKSPEDDPFRENNNVSREDQFWSIRIHDTGIGMNEEVMEQAFNPFFTTKKEGSGTGLGLSMVYSLVQQMNGFVEIHSSPGEGTEVSLYFPATADKEQVPENATKDKIRHGKGKVLLCEDEPIMQKVAVRILEKCGYSLLIASDGVESIDLFQQHHNTIDVVILDMLMPKKNGIEVFREIVKIDPDVKVILSSGFREDERVTKAMEEGVHYFLQKPYSMAGLSDALHQVHSNDGGS